VPPTRGDSILKKKKKKITLVGMSIVDGATGYIIFSRPNPLLLLLLLFPLSLFALPLPCHPFRPGAVVRRIAFLFWALGLVQTGLGRQQRSPTFTHR
jgi:hypothetical protein